MSELQGYAFRAVDRPLGRDDMDELRRISSRAEITPTSFSNFYTFGNFKGDETEMMARWFDVFVYVANWGTHRVMFRIPQGLLDRQEAAAYEIDPGVAVTETEEGHLLIDLDIHTEDYEGWMEEDDADQWLDRLLAVRETLLGGDLPALYLGWLATVQHGDDGDDDATEPPVPAGMKKLPEALAELADFLCLDKELLEVAAANSPARAAGAPTAAGMLEWIKAVPIEEKDDLLLSLMKGDGPHLGRELVRRYQRERAPAGKGAAPAARRTAGAIRAAWEGRAEEARREAEEAAARQRAAAERQAAERRARRLDSLVGQDEKLWRQVEEAVASRVPKRYDEAVELIKDLRDLAARAGAEEAWRGRVVALREKHAGKRTFLERLDKAGLAGG